MPRGNHADILKGSFPMPTPTPRLRWADVRRELKSLGVDASREDHGSGSYEYRVTLADLPPARAEAIASYTDDLKDALGTGRLMGAQKAEQEKAAREAAALPHALEACRALIYGGDRPDPLQSAIDHALNALEALQGERFPDRKNLGPSPVPTTR
jgi:hypothetical protein